MQNFLIGRFLVILFLGSMGGGLLAMESKEDKARNCDRFKQFIQQLERELAAQENYREEYNRKWIHPVNLPWNFESQLAERKSQILKDIQYFHGLLATNYCTESKWSRIFHKEK